MICTGPHPSLPLTRIVMGSNSVGVLGIILTSVIVASAQTGNNRIAKIIHNNFFKITSLKNPLLIILSIA